MFSLAIFYIVTKMIDFILDGINQGKSVMIISGKNKEIGDLLMKNCNYLLRIYMEKVVLGSIRESFIALQTDSFIRK